MPNAGKSLSFFSECQNRLKSAVVYPQSVVLFQMFKLIEGTNKIKWERVSEWRERERKKERKKERRSVARI